MIRFNSLKILALSLRVERGTSKFEDNIFRTDVIDAGTRGILERIKI